MKPLSLSRFLQWPINNVIYRQLGWKRTLNFMQQLGRIFFTVQRRDNAAITQAIHTVYAQESTQTQKARIEQIKRGIVFHYFEKLFNANAPEDLLTRFYDTHITDQGLAALHRARSAGRGALLVTGHLGGLEFMPGFLGYRGVPTSIVAKFATPGLRRACERQMNRFNVKIINAQTSSNVATEMFQHLSANRVVITQCDEIKAWRPDNRTPIRFLGNAISLDRTLNILTRRCKAPVVCGVMHRDRWRRYVFFATEAKAMANRSHSMDRLSIGAVALKFLERFILQFPDEWYHWCHVPELAATAQTTRRRHDTMALPTIDPMLESLTG